MERGQHQLEQFTKSTAYGVINGIVDTQFRSHESSGSANYPQPTTASNVYFRLLVKSNAPTSSYIAVAGSPLVLQLR